MEPTRPSPDALLARLKAEESKAERGSLKVFLGACAGVGKTYAMLEAARALRKENVDVVVGVAETHGRKETEALLEGLEILPCKEIEYRGVRLKEFDLDAALHRKPRLILIDELAHTNAPGSRHPKRWQDVKELLDSGISVYTTLNVQHLEALNDIISQITGLKIHETVPDSFVEFADSLEVVDLPFEELLKRLKEGKVYFPEQAELAVQNFFRPGNISALRELALRFTAEKVNRDVQAFRQDQPDAPTWPTVERLLVLVGPSPTSVRLIRHAFRLANSLRCEWIALHVETPALAHLSSEERDRTVTHLRMAAKLGAEVVTLTGPTVADTTLGFARERNVTRIIVGKPVRRTLRDWLMGTVTHQLVNRSNDIDIVVTVGDVDERAAKAFPPAKRAPQNEARRYAASVAVVALCTVLCIPLQSVIVVDPTNLIMVYLLGVVLLATHLGRGPAVLASILSVLSFDFFFIPPYLTFAVADTQYLLTFLVMLVVALVISTLTVRLRDSLAKSRLREQRTASLNALSRKLAMLRGHEPILRATVEHIAEVFDSEVVALLPDAEGALHVRDSQPLGQTMDDKERAVAQWVHDLGEMVGKGTDTLPAAERLYVPLLASHGSDGALGLKSSDPQSLLIPEQLQLLEALAQQAALALEVDRLTEEAQKHKVQMETERLRNALLSSVSHDLRTPLGAITGSASSLLDGGHPLPEANRVEMIRTIYEEADKLNQQVNNLLEMSRIESGSVSIRKELQPLEETIGSACQRLESQLESRNVKIIIPSDLPLVPVDGVLLERVFFNLLDNAVKYTPKGSPIEIEARQQGKDVLVETRDSGPGLGEGEMEQIFEKFYRGASHGKTGGAGLGLPICRGIILAHGGRIWAENRPGGGAVFKFTIPLDEKPSETSKGLAEKER
jgi:two-component system sensor histidine kinase KdpD